MKRLIALAIVLPAFFVKAQNNPPKYPSLLWEITGNGLTKPSYLFGTMHVSEKLAFHLSDSFYHAIAACDAVSLEVDPKQWQPEMFRVQQSQQGMMRYTLSNLNEFVNDRSFQLNPHYEDRLKRALKEEPAQVNSLLYRTFQGGSDFQENTYLDLYIYQTARRLGKRSFGLENYLVSEKMMLEAQEAVQKEKPQQRVITEDRNVFNVAQKSQDAYRRGDLDLMDSLDKLMNPSSVFNEKFLYPRNEIQANSIDSIIRTTSLFAGVGAAHLPGERGVIELLRKKGYTLRPVKMMDEDAAQRVSLDKMHVPQTFSIQGTPDGFVHVNVPGPLFRRLEAQTSESWQYADMENGAYYMLTRIPTGAAIFGQSPKDVLRKTDSLLYENIPGTILHKSEITRNGYPGLELVNKTRRGDLQRYCILITPSEVILAKMSGGQEYVTGREGDEFFRSIRLEEATKGWTNFTAPGGGFSIAFPEQPRVSTAKFIEDRNDTWTFQAGDESTGSQYIAWKKNINNYHFIEEDTFDLSLIEKSFRMSDIIDHETTRRFVTIAGIPCLNMQFVLKDGRNVQARAMIRGSAQYLLAAFGKPGDPFSRFFGSFAAAPFQYKSSSWYRDSVIRFSVKTPVLPAIDEDLHAYLEESMFAGQRTPQAYVANTTNRFALFRSDSTGEAIMLQASTLPAYFYRRDSVKFWNNEMSWKRLEEDMIVKKQYFYHNGARGYQYTLTDTNSQREIKGLVVLKGNTVYRLNTVLDQQAPQSSFIRDFFETFTPDAPAGRHSVFESRSQEFFEDYASKDSLIRVKAHQGLEHIVFESSDLPRIIHAIAALRPKSRNYKELKVRFIHAIGRISDTALITERIAYLKDAYAAAGDTSLFQNAVVMALSRTQHADSYRLLRKFMTENPPVFANAREYQDLLVHLDDSLQLARTLFPDILQLTSVEDYKVPITRLLYRLVDSGYIDAAGYADYYTKLYFDAQIQSKKQQNRQDEEPSATAPNNIQELMNMQMTLQRTAATEQITLVNYATLLMPFYDQKENLPPFFDKLVRSSDKPTRLAMVALLAKNNKPIPDTILTSLGESDKHRVQLYERLKRVKRLDLFPAAWATQEAMARSVLLNAKSYPKFTEIVPMGKEFVTAKNHTGYVYFFKYRLQANGDWLMGISGLQPADLHEINDSHELLTRTEKKIDATNPEKEFHDRLDQLLTSQHRSATSFYTVVR